MLGSAKKVNGQKEWGYYMLQFLIIPAAKFITLIRI
jgi:hypothetical protein